MNFLYLTAARHSGKKAGKTMADKPAAGKNGKKKRFSLRALFSRKAKRELPPIPEAVLNDKRVQKTIIRRRRRKRLKRILAVLLASSALSTGLQFHPELVSKPYDQYMAEQGYATNLKDHFHAAQINVYDRHSLLYPFHLAGNETRIIWHEAEKKPHHSTLQLAVASPVIYTAGLIKGFEDMIMPQALDAYSMSNGDDPATRTCFIRPPSDFSLAGFFADFSRVNSKDFHFQHSKEDLKRTLFEYVMLHEARHCDQDKSAYTTANEADADLYAFRVLQARGTDPGLLQETMSIITHLRAFNAVMSGDTQHVSTFTLERGSETIFTAHEDAAAFRELRDIIQEAGAHNPKAFPAGMSQGKQAFYLTAKLYKSGLLDANPQVKKAARAFIQSIAYFDTASGGRLIDRNYDLRRIDLSYLTSEYKPVPDKLDVPAAAQPNRPAPRRGYGF